MLGDWLSERGAEREECGVSVLNELINECPIRNEHVDNVLGRAITQANPQDLGRMAAHSTQLLEILILGEEDELVHLGMFPDCLIRSTPQSDIQRVLRPRIAVGDQIYELTRQILVDKEADGQFRRRVAL